MLVKINLLPYRQIRREERQRQFNLLLLAAFAAGAAVVFLGQQHIDGQIEYQQGRNQRLNTAIAQLDKEIAEIKDLKQRIGDVLERKRVVENLQEGRSKAVIMLDELARQLPEGIYLKAIKQKGDDVTLVGVADTDARIATLMRSLGNSQWMEAPELVEINSITEKNSKKSAFTLNVKQKSQQASESAQK